ncbi:MAG: hypothetical protein WC879_06275 [Melioribacteraceae bacterium]
MTTLNFDSPAVQNYLTILQSVINRMANNSSSCKTWCITIISAIIVIVSDKQKPNLVWISIVPLFLFFMMDVYYLSLEKQFRSMYNCIIKKVHTNSANIEDVFIVSPSYNFFETTKFIIKALISFSVYPFYCLLALMVFIVRLWII